MLIPACAHNQDSLTEEQQQAIADTVMILAVQPPAFPSADVSSMQATVVHPDVALLHGHMGMPDSLRDSSTEWFVTMVFVRENGHWSMRHSWGTSMERHDTSSSGLRPVSPELRDYLERMGRR